MRFCRYRLVLEIAPLAIALLGSAACRQTAAARADNHPERLVVAVASASLHPLVRTAEAQGALFPRERTVIASEVSGAVVEVLADFGDRVAAGQPLLKISPREYQLRVDSARAALAQANARLANVRAESGRSEQLRHADLISQAQFDAISANLRVSEADAESAGNALALAEKKLGDTVVRAPFASFLQKRLVALGEYVDPGQKLCELIATDPIKLRAPISERFVPLIKPGLEVSLTVEAAPGRTYFGRITRIAPALDDTSRTLLVEAEVANPDGALRPGYFAHVKVSLGQDRALFVPTSAVMQYAGVERVFVVRDGVAWSREVTTGAVIGDQIEIAHGLNAGDKVVVSDVDRLADGVPVSAREQS